MTRRKRGQKRLEALDVDCPAWWKLKEYRSERATEVAGPLEKALDRRPRILQLLHVSEVAAGFHGVLETTRRAAAPLLERGRLGEAIERVVDFNGVEALRVVLEPRMLRKTRRIEVASPVPVLPPRASHACAERPAG